jgi:hypothetical protein
MKKLLKLFKKKEVVIKEAVPFSVWYNEMYKTPKVTPDEFNSVQLHVRKELHKI